MLLFSAVTVTLTLLVCAEPVVVVRLVALTAPVVVNVDADFILVLPETKLNALVVGVLLVAAVAVDV